MRPEAFSALTVGFALVLGLMLLAFNLGRLDVASKARQCGPTTQTFTIPFKGTLP